MVDVMGHLGFGLLFAIPAWFIWSRRVSLAFIALAVITALIPDIDIWLRKFFPQYVHHHGVTHTVLFSVVVSLIGAAIVAVVLTRPIDRRLRSEHFDRSSMFVLAFAAFLTGALSHLFADMLSAPDIASPIEPFWPFFDKPWSVDILWYNDPMWNSVLLTVAIIIHIALAATVSPINHRYRWRKA